MNQSTLHHIELDPKRASSRRMEIPNMLKQVVIEPAQNKLVSSIFLHRESTACSGSLLDTKISVKEPSAICIQFPT